MIHMITGITRFCSGHLIVKVKGSNRIGPFLSSVSANAIVDAHNSPQLQVITSMNGHPGAGQFGPMGMMNRPQMQQQQMQHQQQWMSRNPGGMRIGSQTMGTHLGPISTNGDSTPYIPASHQW